ncbi:MAG TPA: hypothetical protein VI386_26805 [Candidatus Sulfotelmatobacter sp.]
MASKKKPVKRTKAIKKSKKSAGTAKRAKTAKKQAVKAKTARRPAKKAPRKKAATKAKSLTRAVTRDKTAPIRTSPAEKKRPGRATSAFSRDLPQRRSEGQSGDLQGLSNVESVDSESVDELVEEGNAFEAGIVAGVEDSEGRGEKEVHTREVPEDDVPEEYLDE